MKEIEVKENDKNQRLDRFLNKYYPLMPKSLLNKYIRKKKIKINKKKVDNNQILELGDIINLYIYDEELEKYEEKKEVPRTKYRLNIVYEDDNIICIDKPQGILSHSKGKRVRGKNVVDFLINYLIDKKEYDPRRENTFKPAIINRLDRNTQGIIIACKNYESLQIMNQAIREGMIDRYYKALVFGKINRSMNIDKSLLKVGKNTIIADERGKEAKTLIERESFSKNFSYVNIKLITGRTHQIRVHLKSIGHPIVGDLKYGRIDSVMKDRYSIDNQMLIAYRIKFQKISGMEYLENREIISSLYSRFDQLSRKIMEEDDGENFVS